VCVCVWVVKRGCRGDGNCWKESGNKYSSTWSITERLVRLEGGDV